MPAPFLCVEAAIFSVFQQALIEAWARRQLSDLLLLLLIRYDPPQINPDPE
jgi:hypothetical protein